MKWPNRSEEYENDSRIQNQDLHRRPPEGISAIAAMHQEAILAGYCIAPPHIQSLSASQLPSPAMLAGGAYLPPAGGAQYAMSADYRVAQQVEAARTLRENQFREYIPPPTTQSFSSAQLPPPDILASGAYLPPVGGAQFAMSADYRIAQQAEAARTLRENQSRELLMYAQLDEATTAATATSFPGAAPGRLHGSPFQYHGVPHPPPWAPLRSPAYAPTGPRGPPESTIFHPGDIAAAPSQSLTPQQPEVALSRHGSGDAAAAKWLVEDKIRYSTTQAGPREKRRQRSRVNDPFPVKLMRLLSETEFDGNEHIVSFTPSGHAFQVHKPNEFMRDVAPKYFRQKKFSSFTRQLNMYGFEKVNHGSDKSAFSHPDFQRGKPELCSRIVARIPEDYRSARAL